MDRFIGQYHRLHHQRRRSFGQRHGPTRSCTRSVRIDAGGGRETPSSGRDNPHPDADVGFHERGFDCTVAQRYPPLGGA